MIPVIEISKRRSHLRQVPPGFPIQKKSDVNNNYGIFRKEIEEANHISNTNHHRVTNSSPEKINIQTIALQLNSNNNRPIVRRKGLQIQASPMMPVLEVARKRAIGHPIPPGFKQLPILDTNNNAGRKDYRTSTREARYLQKAQNRPNDTDNPIIGCFKLVKSELLLTPEEIESLKPDCLKGKEETITKEAIKSKKEERKENSNAAWKYKMGKIKKFIHPEKFKEGLKILKPRKGPIFVKADTRKDVIGGDEVVVNVLTFDPEEVDDVEGLEVRDYTPENFYETSEYFELLSDNRKHVTRLIYSLGDMLLANQIDGSRDEWKYYTDKMCEEERLWKKRCREDDIIFENTGRSSGVKDVFWSSQLMKCAKDTLTHVKNFLSVVCPCFFSKRERLKN